MPPEKSMTRRLFTLLLLAVFGFGLFAGPHPCAVAHGEREKSAPPSCHAAAHPADGPEVSTDASPSDDGKNCCDTFCRHACHMTAVAEAVPVTFAIAPVSLAVAEVTASEISPIAHPIDHIPLG
jgi:hypothetical protein